MPSLSVIALSEAPPFTRSSRAQEAKKALYNQIVKRVREAPRYVGEIIPENADETIRSIKQCLKRASGRVGCNIKSWDNGSSVFFRVVF